MNMKYSMKYSIVYPNEVFLTQKIYRTLLQAMARPGEIYSLSVFASENGLILLAITLLDEEVSFHIIGEDKEKLAREIYLKTGSKFENIEKADFVIITSGDSKGLLLSAKRGTLLRPDLSATVIYLVHTISKNNCNGVNISLRGPGIKDKAFVCIKGIKKEEFYYLQEVNSEYPLGVDSIFIDKDNNIVCIPRSSKLEVV